MIKFGTGGFRATIGEDFTKESVQKIAQALCKIIKKSKVNKPVVVGYDRRFMSDYYARWVAEVFAGNKIVTKIYTRPVPTPMVMTAVKEEGLDYGITITASHNPYFYNGFKICVAGGKDADNEFTNQVQKIANRNIKIRSTEYNLAITNGLIIEYDSMKDYIKGICKTLSKTTKENNIKLLFNAMHGVTNEPIKLLAKKLNLKKLEVIKEDTDVFFEYSVTSPEESNIEDMKKMVTKGKYSLGIACDGDGDRIAVIDELGNYYNANTLIPLIYYYLVKYRGMEGDIVKNQSTSTLCDKLANAFGFKCHEVPVGFKYISSKMKEVDALIGGESSGGLAMRGYTPCKDSMFATALLLDAMANMEKPLSEMIAEVKTFAEYISTYVEGSVTVASKAKIKKALKKVTPAFPYKPTQVIKATDGTKYVFEDGSFVLIRFSGTEELLRYAFEFQTEIECERVQKAIETYIAMYDKK